MHSYSTSTSNSVVAHAHARNEPREGIEAIYASAHWLYLRESYDDAACMFRVMLQLVPVDERGWVGLGACHEQLGQPTIALQMYAAAMAIARPGVLCRVARARLLREMGRESLADEALEDAVRTAEATESDSLMQLVAEEVEAVHASRSPASSASAHPRFPSSER